MTEGTAHRATQLLRAIAGPDASFHPGQLQTIVSLVEERSHLLLVQRTGWGKSAVYFIASRILRERGAGPTLLVSPLLALMRNQIEMAQRAGIRAETINSANREKWEAVEEAVDAQEIDLLLVSPERLNNPKFRQEILPALTRRPGLLVVDEAHCVSDWGHDFRPDYRRVARVIELLPPHVPVLGTTATANDRVTEDVRQQLGLGLAVRRGSLDRESLRLHAARMPDQAERMAWLAHYLPKLPGSGIVYCLTVADAKRLAAWLRANDIDAEAYHGRLDDDKRLEIEDRLSRDEVEVVVATSALGMGYDKPNLGFVVHFQSPGSPVHYYQQVGRAGRAVDEAYGILLAGGEDADIQDHFISVAFPPRRQAEEVVSLLSERAAPVPLAEIEAQVNVRKSRLEAMLKVLEVEGAVERTPEGWLRTLRPWSYDQDRVDHVTAQRRAEQRAMTEYLGTQGCLMAFLRRQLDDPGAESCGRCGNCERKRLPTEVSPDLVAAAVEHLRWQPLEIEPRKQWPKGFSGASGRIGEELRPEPGRAMSVFGDAGWGRLVKHGKFTEGRFSEELVRAAVDLVTTRWRPQPEPTWVTFVPSLRRPELVADLAARISQGLGVPCRPSIDKVRDTLPQKEMENSPQQAANVHGAFAVLGTPDPGPVLLIDDIVDSRWTLTVVAMLLRAAGSGVVHPLALADAQPG